MADAHRTALGIVDKAPERFLSGVPATVLRGGYGLLTLHRPENTDDVRTLRALVEALNELRLDLLFPVHPRTRKALGRGGLSLADHVHCVEPLGYLEMTAILSRARLVLTDSGGLQKEAYWARVPCITLRGQTEWVETLQTGWNILATSPGDIAPALDSHLTLQRDHPPLYGDGHAAKRIVETIAAYA
jgi:UDP-GlcNAc3NAcA epimerase